MNKETLMDTMDTEKIKWDDKSTSAEQYYSDYQMPNVISKDYEMHVMPYFDVPKVDTKLPIKYIHIKVYCSSCGELLLHEKRAITENQKYLGLSVDPCPVCGHTMYAAGVVAGEGKQLRGGMIK